MIRGLSTFSGTAGDYLYCRVEQHEREGKEGDKSDADTKKYRPQDIKSFHHRYSHSGIVILSRMSRVKSFA